MSSLGQFSGRRSLCETFEIIAVSREHRGLRTGPDAA
jgi:hypothetical protein